VNRVSAPLPPLLIAIKLHCRHRRRAESSLPKIYFTILAAVSSSYRSSCETREIRVPAQVHNRRESRARRRPSSRRSRELVASRRVRFRKCVRRWQTVVHFLLYIYYPLQGPVSSPSFCPKSSAKGREWVVGGPKDLILFEGLNIRTKKCASCLVTPLQDVYRLRGASSWAADITAAFSHPIITLYYHAPNYFFHRTY